jgi:hypothetical protein
MVDFKLGPDRCTRRLTQLLEYDIVCPCTDVVLEDPMRTTSHGELIAEYPLSLIDEGRELNSHEHQRVSDSYCP